MVQSKLAIYLTPTYLIGAALLLAFLYPIIVRVRYALKFKRAGGVAMPDAGSDPVNSAKWLIRVAKAHNEDKILEIFQRILREFTGDRATQCVQLNPLGGLRYIFTAEPEHMKTILTGKFADYGKGPMFHKLWSPLLGDSIFTTDGKQWQDSRNMLRPMFIKNRVSDLEIFERYTQTMLDQMPADGSIVDVQTLFYRMTIDVITEFLLGESINSLKVPKSDFVEAFTVAQRWQILLTVMSPIDPIVPRKPYTDAIKVMDKFMLPIIKRAMAISPDELAKLTKSDSGFTFLHAIAQYSRDPKVVRDQIVAVLLAGRDTTAATLSWALYELSNNASAYAKLRQEVLEVVGPDRVPTYDDLKGMKYLTNVLNETLRLYPAVPFNVRAALQDSTLVNNTPGEPDFSVVKGDLIIYSPLAMQRRADIYPPPSEKFPPASVFSPERWQEWQPKAWSYIPFNGGPRICVGQQFALVEMSYVLIRFCQRFEKVDYRGGRYEDQFHKVEIVGCPGNSVKVSLTAAQKA